MSTEENVPRAHITIHNQGHIYTYTLYRSQFTLENTQINTVFPRYKGHSQAGACKKDCSTWEAICPQFGQIIQNVLKTR